MQEGKGSTGTERSVRLTVFDRQTLRYAFIGTVYAYRIRGMNLDKDAIVEKTPANMTIER